MTLRLYIQVIGLIERLETINIAKFAVITSDN